MYRFARQAFLLLAVILMGVSASFGDTVVTPSGAAGTEGAGFLPLGGSGGVRIQTVFDASLFSGLGPLVITGVTVRPDAGNTQATGTTMLTLLAEQTALTPATLSYVYADNLLPGYTTAYTGSYTFSMPTTGAGPRPFSDVLTFMTPVYYDPSSGLNLLCDFSTSSPVAPPGTPRGVGNVVALDSTAQNVRPAAGDQIFSVVGVNNLSAVRGVRVTGGPVYEIEYMLLPTPEPGTLPLLGLGLAGAALGVWRRRKK
jgi:hypothetical protein